MNIIIPIGGVGQRFKDEGYLTPKPLINVLGEPMICKVISGLNIKDDDNIYIVYNPELNSYNFESLIRFKFPKIKINFLELDKITRGASETVLEGLSKMTDDEILKETILLDCDTFYLDDILETYRKQGNKNTIFYFIDKDESPIFSYIKTNSSGMVTNIKEKIKISDKANTGAYGFQSGSLLKEYCERILKLETELYTSLIYEEMIKDGLKISSAMIDNFHCVGTPLQLKIYCESNKSSKKTRVCFDLDNTLVSYPKIQGDYETVEPIQKNIEYLRFLKEQGSYIIIYTARRMKTHKGNLGALIADIGKVTLQTLENFNIPYDEIHFGKPHADFYIDDLAVNCFHPIDKILGFINTRNEPRYFNEIKYEKNKVIKTTNNPGETYWYNNMPESISHLFPKIELADADVIEMEKIRGINYSYLYTNGGLREDDIDLLIDKLRTIHSSKSTDEKIDWYKNYVDKIKERYLNNLDLYKRIPESDTLFKILLERMEKYKESNKCKIGVIHGDPVFTNIFLTEIGIKYIDPRGKVGEHLTIFGDVYYDFAKVYQSILGYDFILNDIDLNFEYLERIKNAFESKFTDDEMIVIKNITASLFFTLIPLHIFSSDKFNRYIKIIKSLI